MTKRQTILRRRNAMNTVFEVLVRHADEEHAEAAADAALDEVVRVESVLSRFDRASETFRVNREAAAGTALASVELMDLLEACRDASERTAGAFDVTAVSRGRLGAFEGPAVEIDVARRRVRFARPGVFLDFGGCGKGYALDRAAAMLRTAGIAEALLHGGTSSFVAMSSEGGWTVGYQNPFQADAPVENVVLKNAALSCSASRPAPGGEAGGVSDIVVPGEFKPVGSADACVARAPIERGGFVSEVLSTALLALGRAGAQALMARGPYNGATAAWVERGGGSARLAWLGEPPTESTP
jgi:thiamine biosynthesis lipoprotein